jgi:ethanolamine utilization microcompartment shell protein EutL
LFNAKKAVSNPGNPDGGLSESFSSSKCGAWSVPIQSINLSFSAFCNAVTSFWWRIGGFIFANEDDSIAYYAHCISRTGSYLSEACGIKEGEAIAYLIAPPLEAIYAVDAALKAADVKCCVLYAPPSETNFGGALLTGSQSACKSACDAFAAAVEAVADRPIE